MTRTFRTLLLCSALALVPAASALAQDGRPTLRLKVEVTSDMVLMGDLFDNIDVEKAQARVDQAPAPGITVTYQPSQLAAFARANGVDWKPQTYMDKVVVARIGQVVPRATIDAALKRALGAKGVTGDLDFEIASRAYAIHVSETQAPSVAVELVHFDPDSRAFIAEFRAPADEPRADKIRIAGRAHEMINVPVLSRRMMPNEVIRATDLAWVKMRSGPALNTAATLREDVLGKVPRRPLQAGQPLRQSDLGANLLVTRNETVTMIVRTPTMTLTAQGKALEDGGEGQMIKIQNPKSMRTVEGRVTGQGEVSVGTLMPVLAAAAPPARKTVQR